MTDYRDGRVHRVGPITLRYRGENIAGLEEMACTIRTEEGAEYIVDFGYAEAFAHAFEALPPNLFSASESDKDKEVNEQGQRRGFLRFRASSDTRRHGQLAAVSRNEVYQVARIIADASDEEEVQPINFTDEGRRDYRRASLKREFSPRARTRTRVTFVDGICSRIQKLHGDEAAEAMRRGLLARFAVADGETGDPRVLMVTPKGRGAA